MSDSTYYRDHWVTVEPERLDAYEEMFRWRPQLEPLLVPARLEPGLTVVDYGCGPGHLSVELARRVGPGGRVLALDLNADFLKRTAERAAAEGLAERVLVHHVSNDELPLPSGSVDRVICKNVLEYVDDPGRTLAAFRRVLRPGGLAHVIDSDWGLLAVEPLGPERCAELFAAARHAYRTPHVGRQLHGLFRRNGFRDVQLQVLANADVKGHMASVVWNMVQYARASGRLTPAVLDTIVADVKGHLAAVVLNMVGYARASGKLPAATLDAIVTDLRRAIAAGDYLLFLPQFLVTGSA